MTSKEQYLEFLREAEDSLEYREESAIVDFTQELHRIMDNKSVNRSELAQRLGVSPAYITKMLYGSNFRIRTMAKIARALDMVVRIHLAPDHVTVQWTDLPDEATTANASVVAFQEYSTLLSNMPLSMVPTTGYYPAQQHEYYQEEASA